MNIPGVILFWVQKTKESAMKTISLVLLAFAASSGAFAPSAVPSRTFVTKLHSTPSKSAAQVAAEIDADDARVQVPGQLPKLKNNLYDENEKFKEDEDWITENVPGKIVLSELELAAQVTALSKLEEKWRKESLQREYDEQRLLGFTQQAEMYNGRFAMFFLVVGLLTEYWTGFTIPGQIEEMLRVVGIIEPS